MSKARSEPMPTFDFSTFSHRESKEMGRVQLRLQRLAAQLSDAAGLSDDDFDAKMAQMDALIEQAESYICRILRSVPESWVVTGAPDDIDWTQPDNLNYIRTDKMDVLRDAAVQARAPESVSGN